MNRLQLSLIFLSALVLLSSQVAAQCGACEFLSENLVVNGDFEDGNTGFTSDYSLATVPGPFGLLSAEGQYVIDNDASDAHTFFQGFDHTNPPFGNFMMVNGSGTPNTSVWCQTIEVIPNQSYDFSAWVRNIDTNPQNSTFAELQFFINGNPLGPVHTADGAWEEISVEWFSGNNTTIDICLINQQNEGGGNDFGVDDISFITCFEYDVTAQADAGEDQTICSGETVTLGTPELEDFEYDWDGTGINVQQSGQAQPTFSLINNGDEPLTYTYVMTIDTAGLGCVQTDEVTVTVNPLPEPDLGEDLIICDDEVITIDAGAGWEAVTWQDGSAGQTFDADAPGVYEATVTLLGCQASDDIELLAPDLPDIDLGADFSICEDETATLAGGAEGLWSTGEVAQSIEVNEQNWYWLEVENQGCTRRDSLFLTTIVYPELDLDSLIELCPGESHTYYVSQEGQWTTGEVSDSLVVNAPGVYGVTLNNAQCAVSDESTVEFFELPSVELGPDQLLCIRDIVELNVEGAFNDSVLWTDGSEEFIREISETGLYGVLVWNQCGTAEDDVELVFEDCDFGLYIPNAFTPDGDGVNEVWCPIGLNMVEMTTEVYNRWGELIFYSEELEPCWNGNVNGGGYYVPDGMYVYRVTALTDQAVPIVETGSIVILR